MLKRKSAQPAYAKMAGRHDRNAPIGSSEHLASTPLVIDIYRSIAALGGGSSRPEADVLIKGTFDPEFYPPSKKGAIHSSTRRHSEGLGVAR